MLPLQQPAAAEPGSPGLQSRVVGCWRGSGSALQQPLLQSLDRWGSVFAMVQPTAAPGRSRRMHA